MSIGLPAWLAYLTIVAEAIGGVLLVLGWHTRVVALALIPTLLGAIIWVHAANGWVFSAKGGGWEYPAFLIVASIVLALLGDGALLGLPSGATSRLKDRRRRQFRRRRRHCSLGRRRDLYGGRRGQRHYDHIAHFDVLEVLGGFANL